MKSVKRILILCCAVLLMAGISLAETVDAVDFSNGNYGFLSVYNAPPDAGSVTLSLATVDGQSAVRVAPDADGIPYLVIDAGGLLGDALSDLREMRVTVGVENPDGVFHAVSGEITALDGSRETGLLSSWSVYLEDKNPNIAKMAIDDPMGTFSSGEASIFLLSKKVDNAIEEGQAPSNLLIYQIVFLDAQGDALPVNPDAVFAPPSGFGELDRSGLLDVTDEVTIDGAAGASSGWGQAVALLAEKNDGPLDVTLIAPGTVLTAYYASATPPELIAQSWTEGAPAQAGWAKVAPAHVNSTATIAQFLYEDIIEALGTDDLATYLDQLFVGDTGESLTLSSLTIGTVAK